MIKGSEERKPNQTLSAIEIFPLFPVLQSCSHFQSKKLEMAFVAKGNRPDPKVKVDKRHQPMQVIIPFRMPEILPLINNRSFPPQDCYLHL